MPWKWRHHITYVNNKILSLCHPFFQTIDWKKIRTIPVLFTFKVNKNTIPKLKLISATITKKTMLKIFLEKAALHQWRNLPPIPCFLTLLRKGSWSSLSPSRGWCEDICWEGDVDTCNSLGCSYPSLFRFKLWTQLFGL